MSILSPSGLETMDYNQPAWDKIFCRNFEIINALLLKVNKLGDVSATPPTNHQILTYSTASSTYVPRSYP